MEIKGIDVSKWQGTINWDDVKKEGTEFAIIREGWGKKSPTQIDKKFKENYENAKAAGIPLGCYHYSYADSIYDAKKEAEFCLENIQGLKLEYPVCFDIEDREMLKLSNRQRTDIVKSFCEEIEKAGFYAMFYCNLNWLSNYLYKDELLPKYDLWLAQWSVGLPSVSCGIWQKTDKGVIDGICGNVDIDIAYKNYPEIIKAKGLNGFDKSSNVASSNHFVYTVKKGDTLWALAQRYLGSSLKYKDIKTLNSLNSDTIYIGQNLKIPE